MQASSYPPPNISAFSSPASLPRAEGFLEQLLTYGDLPKSPRFPSLSVVPCWDFYNYLCLLHPYHTPKVLSQREGCGEGM